MFSELKLKLIATQLLYCKFGIVELIQSELGNFWAHLSLENDL